jgi:hypothetical protein
MIPTKISYIDEVNLDDKKILLPAAGTDNN